MSFSKYANAKVKHENNFWVRAKLKHINSIFLIFLKICKWFLKYVISALSNVAQSSIFLPSVVFTEKDKDSWMKYYCSFMAL